MSNIDQQFIEYIVKELVSHPDDVKIDRTIDEKGVLLTLTVNDEDLGRVIGRRGVTAQSLRTLLRVLGTKNDARYNLKIANNDEPEEDEKPAKEKTAKSKKDEAVEAAKKEAEEVTPEEAAESADEETAPEPEEAKAAEPAEEAKEESEDDKPSLADKTREELAELDDLDI
ncbi:KH domain-containing protein [Candidatus Saccharibacteria bacterium]|nr:KH domain-containing protein [Candidatus Saccharibacteria bacterium]